MTNDDFDDLVKFGAAMAGIWLLSEFLKSLGKDITINRCPVCGFILKKKYPICPRCNTPILWKNPTKEGVPPITEKLSTKPWWVGCFVLVFSLLMLGACTLWHVANPTAIEIWKFLAYVSIGYVIGIPMGVSMEKGSSQA